MSSATGTDRPQGRIARLRAHPLGQLIERGVRLAAIGSAVVVVHDRVLSFQRFASEPDCGCLPPEDVDELVATWPVDAPPSERHETPQIDAEEREPTPFEVARSEFVDAGDASSD